jgi:hypothetical protein
LAGCGNTGIGSLSGQSGHQTAKLVECALVDKQTWAFQQIADRLEGKPVQVVDATVDDNRAIQQFSDAELTAILRRRVGVVSVESDEERPESGALN